MTVDTTARNVRSFLAEEMRRSFPEPRHRLVTQTSEEFLASGNPRALALHQDGALLPYVSFFFEPPGLDVAHVGCVLTEPDSISVGLHLVGAAADTFRSEMERLSAATGLPIVQATAVGEVQCNAAPVAITGDGPQQLAAKAMLFCLWLEHAIGS